jgi:hypothetical protein
MNVAAQVWTSYSATRRRILFIRTRRSSTLMASARVIASATASTS